MCHRMSAQMVFSLPLERTLIFKDGFLYTPTDPLSLCQNGCFPFLLTFHCRTPDFFLLWDSLESEGKKAASLQQHHA